MSSENKYELKSCTYNNTLKLFLDGEISCDNIKAYQEIACVEIQKKQPKKLVLDFSKVTFIDNSGIGFIVYCYKLVRKFNGEVTIENSIDSIKRIMRFAGLDRIATIG